MYRVSQLIASTNTTFFLQNDLRTIVIDFINVGEIDSVLMQLPPGDFQSANNLSLHFENLRGNDLLPVIDIYLNLYDERVPNEQNYVGAMALFGLGESSTESKEHDGSGQHRVFDVGRVFRNVHSQSDWSKKQFKITLIPYSSLPIDATLSIGRIALYFHEN